MIVYTKRFYRHVTRLSFAMHHVSFLIVLLFSLGCTGCLFIPYSTEDIEATFGSIPFSQVTIWKDSSGIYLSIFDPNRDLQGLSIKNASITDHHGRTFSLQMKEQHLAWTASGDRHQDFICHFGANGLVELETPFHLNAVAYLGGEHLEIHGTFEKIKRAHITNAWDLGR